MRKQIYLLILIVANLFMAQSLIAQSNGLALSVFGALSKSSINGESESWKDPIGAQAGVIFTFASFGESLGLRVEINGSMQGAKWEEDFGEGIVKGRTNLLYANAPLVVRYQTKSGFFGEVGFQPGLLLSAKDKYSGITSDYKDQVKKFDFGIPVGVGYEFKNNIGVGLRVIQGLSNINTEGNSKDHNFVAALRGTYTFKIK